MAEFSSEFSQQFDIGPRMAFDRNNPADLAALKSEVNTDPLSMGYDPSHHPTLLNLLNDPDENLGGETTSRVFDVSAMLDALDVDDLPRGSTNLQATGYIQMLVTFGEFNDIEPYKEKFRALFGGGNSTVANLDAQNSLLSRAEVLFGLGTIITKNDWFAARDS